MLADINKPITQTYHMDFHVMQKGLYTTLNVSGGHPNKVK